MMSKIKLISSVTLVFLGIIIFLGCNNVSKQTNSNTIYVSILPQKYMVEQISGGVFNVQNFLPVGANPATFSPSPKKMQNLSNAIAYIKIGNIGFELTWMSKIEATNPQMKTFDQSTGVEFISEGDKGEGKNPHIWLSIKEDKIQLINICKYLSDLKPKKTKYFKRRRDSMLQVLDTIQNSLDTKFAQLTNRIFIIYHPSLSYFARDFKLKQIPIEVQGKEPSLKYMVKLINTAKKMKLNKVFIQKEFPKDKAQTIAKELNAEIVIINPLEYNCFDNINVIANKIANSLNN